MIFRVTVAVEAKAESKNKRSKKISSVVDGFDVTLHFKKHVLYEITLEKRLAKDEAVQGMALAFPVTGKEKLRHFDVIQDAKELLQYLESIGSLWFGIRNIDMGNMRIEWKNERRGKRQELGFNFETNTISNYSDAVTMIIDQEGLASILGLRADLNQLTIPMAFYREGLNERAKGRFGNAFINFFLMLEGLYGNGQFGERQLNTQFKATRELTNAVDGLLKETLPEYVDKQLEAWLRAHNKLRNRDGIIEMLTKVRGDLHHYSMRSTRNQGTPLNQTDFLAAAYVARIICTDIYRELHEQLTGTKITPIITRGH